LQIQEFWHDQNGWHANNLTRAAGSAPSPVRASPVAYAAEFQQTQHVHYVGGDGHLHELWWDTDGWHHPVLLDSNGPEAGMGADAGARPGAFAVPAAQKEYVYYPSINFRVAELWGPARWSAKP